MTDVDPAARRGGRRRSTTPAAGPGAAAFDVADYPAARRPCRRPQHALDGTFDTVVNNAGISPKHDGKAHLWFEMSSDEWRRVVDVNLTGGFNTSRR